MEQTYDKMDWSPVYLSKCSGTQRLEPCGLSTMTNVVVYRGLIETAVLQKKKKNYLIKLQFK